jgi:hypothetical protein
MVEDPLNIENVSIDVSAEKLGDDDDLGEFDATTASFLGGQQIESDANEDPCNLCNPNETTENETAESGQSSAQDTDDAWYIRWSDFLKARGESIEMIPSISGRSVDFYTLYQEVVTLGGLEKVIISKQMARVAASLGFERNQQLRLSLSLSLPAFSSDIALPEICTEPVDFLSTAGMSPKN